MGRKATIGLRRIAPGLLGACLFLGIAMAQRPAPQAYRTNPDWRRIGNSAFEFALPSVATGAVDRVWFAPDGFRLLVRTAAGKVLQTVDFESWKPAEEPVPPPVSDEIAARPPETPVRLRTVTGSPGRVYALGRSAWRSDDGGMNWANLTAYRRQSILGEGFSDMAASPVNPDEIVVVNAFGVWRSMDAGLSWSGLNGALPNLPVSRIMGLPAGSRGARVLLEQPGVLGTMEVEWSPGEKSAWKPLPSAEYAQEAALRDQLSTVLEAEVTAVAVAGNGLYAGSSDGRLWFSPDQGQTWTLPFSSGGGRVESIYAENGLALAALSGTSGPRVLRTISAGSYWRDLTANLAPAAVYRLAADRGTGAVYAATAGGLFYTFADLQADGPATAWAALGDNLPKAPVRDVKLDAARNQLYTAVEGYGVFVAIAPHRFAEPRIVSAADFSERPASPGALLSVLGGRVRAARTGNVTVPVLDASETSSQIQVPFEVSGSRVPLLLDTAGGLLNIGLPLQPVSPGIFVDPEGAPFLIDSGSGVMVSSTRPARSGARIQILASGLGRTRPDWPTGLAAPLDNPPQVAAALRVYLDRLPLAVKQATLAPGYIGFYLVEVDLPDIVNTGPAELSVEADGQASNRVRIYLEP